MSLERIKVSDLPESLPEPCEDCKQHWIVWGVDTSSFVFYKCDKCGSIFIHKGYYYRVTSVL